MTALVGENFLYDVFQVRFLSCRGLEGCLAASFQVDSILLISVALIIVGIIGPRFALLV
jgi:hypothetical protein